MRIHRNPMKLCFIFTLLAVLIHADSLKTECSPCKPDKSQLIAAVKAGFPVTYSSVSALIFSNYRL